MKRVLLAVVLIAAVVGGIDVLGDLTQSRPDPVRDDAVTELVMSLDQDRFAQGDDAAAAALWAVCAGQTHSRADAPPADVGDGRYRVVLAPAVGANEERKLRGCLEDLTVDRVLGNVESWRTLSVTGAR